MFFVTTPSFRPGRFWRAALGLKLASTVVGGVLIVLATGLDGARAAETDPPSKRVSYADLDLRAPAGRATLERRVKLAARQVCGDDGYVPGPPVRAKGSCFQLTLAQAMAQVDRVVVLAQLDR